MLKWIISFISDKLILILSSLSVLLFISCLAIYIGSQTKDLKITNLENRVTQLTNDNKILENKAKNEKIICDATTEGVQEQQREINSVKSDTNEVLKKLIDAGIKDENNSKNSNVTNSGNLSDDDIRLLSDYCERIRGSPCEDPR